MAKREMPVPLGFAIAQSAHESFMEETGARREIEGLLREGEDPNECETKGELRREVQAIIMGKEMPRATEEAIATLYEDLCSRRGYEVAVQLRPAGIVVYPGIYETLVNVKGKQHLLAAVKRVWASIFTHVAACEAVKRGLSIPCTAIGVIELINARSAGVCFTVHPTTGDPSKAVIETNWGLGESVLTGQVDVDTYLIDKVSLTIIEKTLGQKKMQMVLRGHGMAKERVPTEKRFAYAISDEEAIEVVRIGLSLESHFGTPQILEFAMEALGSFRNNVFLLGARAWLV
jgi:pyruvate,water dikinase